MHPLSGTATAVGVASPAFATLRCSTADHRMGHWQITLWMNLMTGGQECTTFGSVAGARCRLLSHWPSDWRDALHCGVGCTVAGEPSRRRLAGVTPAWPDGESGCPAMSAVLRLFTPLRNVGSTPLLSLRFWMEWSSSCAAIWRVLQSQVAWHTVLARLGSRPLVRQALKQWLRSAACWMRFSACQPPCQARLCPVCAAQGGCVGGPAAAAAARRDRPPWQAPQLPCAARSLPGVPVTHERLYGGRFRSRRYV